MRRCVNGTGVDAARRAPLARAEANDRVCGGERGLPAALHLLNGRRGHPLQQH